uniref:Photosystem I assembly protein Ycf4 n=1 Tax=Takakia lepidozioides TaxID=37425 RepID=B3IUF2_TAKLE|nr:photosystem I assembly protein [Takakia lepidozioides]BAG50136.1 photosystem I assembly protein [Takakia lepidozioides]BDD17423.1 photosystem I assembly protein Ycf4 [Takakia lepidozioides]
MNWQSEWLRVEPIIGSRRISNFCWACIIPLGALGFFSVGISSYFGKDLIPFLSSQQILFVPQGIVMCFYGIAGLFLSLYLWCTILWSVGSGYNRFDKREKIVCLFRWGFPGENRRIRIQFLMKDIQAIRMEIREGIYPRRILYMKIKGQQDVPLTRIEENLTLGEMEEKAAELARFLRVSIEGL